MDRLKERLERSAALLAIIDRSREDTGDPNLGANIERIVIDRVIRELEEDARGSRYITA
jgi:hypothetical protein